MANTKLTDLVAVTAASDDDVMYLVTDTGTTPASKKITVENFKSDLEPALPSTPADPANKFLNGNRQWSPIGIADNNVVKIDSATVADDDFAKFTANGLEGRSATEVLSDISAETTANKKTSLADNSDTYYPSQKAVKTAVDAKQDTLTFGIANTNAVQIDAADVADNDYAKFTAGGIEGRSYAEVLSDIGALPLAGGTMSGNITLGENTSIALDPSGSADGKYSGITVTGTAGATIAFGDLITLDKDDSRWELVDISVAAAATGDARGILGMAVSAGNDGDAITILLNGIIRADANFPALTIGAAVYASTSGDIVVTQPSTKDYVIRIVGYALTADEIYFNPENDWISHV